MRIPPFRLASVGTSIHQLRQQRHRLGRHRLGWILLTVGVTAACNGSGNDAIEPVAEDTTTTTQQTATTTTVPSTTTVLITTAPTATTSTATTAVPTTTVAATTTVPTTTTAPTTTVAPTTTTTAPSHALQITIANFAYSGDSSGSVGDTVTVRNNDSVTHTWTAVGGAFHSGNLGGGGTFTYTFESEGTFDYLCQIHPSMTGSITISG